MVEAKGEATYIVEPTNSDIDASNGFTVRKRFKDTETTTTYTTNVTTMFTDILDQMTRPTASSSTMRGGTLFLKNGTYILDTAGMVASNSTDGASIHLRIIGESRERTILKAGFTGTDQLLNCICSVDVENITFNGNSNATINGINTDANNIPTKILKVKNCKFTNIEGFNIFLSTNQYGVDVSECIFENQQNNNDQFALECTGYANIHDNLFDRTTGTTNGEILTSGSAKNCNIHDNIFIRPEDGDNAISMEGFNAHNNYDNVFIHDNLVKNGVIVVGSSGTWVETFRNIAVSNNLVYKGRISVRGPDTGFTDLVKDVTVENNTLIDSWGSGIVVLNVAGYTTVRNNTIKNSNKSLDPITFDKGAIYLEASTDTVCENNNIYMGVVSPPDANFCPFGIKYVSMVNPTIRNNRILNRTVANPAYVSSGSHSGSILISRSL
jgi:Right handed beta helix region